MTGIEQFEVTARDSGSSEETVMVTGVTPRQARTKLVLEAGAMTMGGWTVVGLGRLNIVLAHPDDDGRRTTIKMRKVRT